MIALVAVLDSEPIVVFTVRIGHRSNGNAFHGSHSLRGDLDPLHVVRFGVGKVYAEADLPIPGRA